MNECTICCFVLFCFLQLNSWLLEGVLVIEPARWHQVVLDGVERLGVPVDALVTWQTEAVGGTGPFEQ
uniref:Putative secreted protein n=1 Tax=Anopheles darlingi TaxID=43151 RepID=A0A2M4DFU6_ANODA